MKKLSLFLLSLSIAVAAFSCKVQINVHDHEYSKDWSSDADYHWHKSTCEHSSEISGKGKHDWKLAAVITPATCVTKGECEYKCSVCGKVKTEEVAELFSSPVDAQTFETATESSTYIYFGVFPKTIKASSVIVDESISVTMGANTYYQGDDGEWYAKLIAKPESSTYTYSDGTIITTATAYFKVEPIKWKILTKDYNGTGNALLFAEEIVTANIPYYVSKSKRTIGGKTVYSDNYKYSRIRAYLNGKFEEDDIQDKTEYTDKGFLQTAFTSNAQELIEITDVDNFEESTTDKIFLLNKTEITNEALGFDKKNSIETNKARIRMTTDYAKANYAKQSATYGNGGEWWLRSTNYNSFGDIVDYDGNYNCLAAVNFNDKGIVPALVFSFKSINNNVNKKNHTHIEGKGIVTTAPTCVTKGVRTVKCSICGYKRTEEIEALGWCENAVDAQTGNKANSSSKYVYFGVFPKTVLPSGSSITIDETESVTMGANTYYKGSDGEWYVKVKENGYSRSGCIYTDGTEVKQLSSSIRYFKVEPIKWKVLTADYNGTKNALLLAEEILTGNVPYNVHSSGCTIGGNTIYANNYKYSKIRAYLNGKYEEDDPQDKTYVVDGNGIGFLQTAFTVDAQKWIADTTVVNDAASTSDATGTLPKADGSYDTPLQDFTCSNTTDKIFLLSEQEVTTPQYGFAEYNKAGIGNSRIRVTTDYAKANRAYQDTATGSGGYWWLRSPYAVMQSIVYSVSTIGDTSYYIGEVNYDCYGVVPALTLSLE